MFSVKNTFRAYRTWTYVYDRQALSGIVSSIFAFLCCLDAQLSWSITGVFSVYSYFYCEETN